MYSKRITKIFNPLVFSTANCHQLEYSLKSEYQIPADVLNTFHMVNATVWDNMKYNVHTGIQICHKQLIEDNKDIAGSEPSSKKTLQNIINLLTSCLNVFEFNIPLMRDNGMLEMVKAYRVRHSDYTLPCLGGVRITDKISLSDLQGLALLLTIKHANLRLPFAGSFGSIQLSPTYYSAKELEQVISSYTSACLKHGTLNSTADVHYPDLNFTNREINWMSKTIEEYPDSDLSPTAAIVGKTNDGIEGYYNAAALSSYHALNNLFLDFHKMSVLGVTQNWEGKNFVIHGFGKVGQSLAIEFVKHGAKCVGIQDLNDVALYNSEGIDIQQLISYKNEKGTIYGFQGAHDYQSNLLNYCADVLVLSSTPKVVNCFTVGKVTAKIIVEVAYGAITPTAYRTLLAKNILVLPDVLSAAGTEIAAYMEYVKNVNNIKFGQIGWEENITMPDLKKVKKKINQASSGTVNYSTSEEIILKNIVKNTMSRVGSEMMETLEKFNLGLDLRMACYVNALRKICRTIYVSGKCNPTIN